MIEIQIYFNKDKSVKKAQEYLRHLVKKEKVKQWIIKPEITASNIEGFKCMQCKFEE